jgi:hypothetical protein
MCGFHRLLAQVCFMEPSTAQQAMTLFMKAKLPENAV